MRFNPTKMIARTLNIGLASARTEVLLIYGMDYDVKTLNDMSVLFIV
jgi:hypothetical protein